MPNNMPNVFNDPLSDMITYAEKVHAEANVIKALPVNVPFGAMPCPLYLRCSTHQNEHTRAAILAREIRNGHPNLSLSTSHNDSTFGFMAMVFRHLYARAMERSGGSQFVSLVDDTNEPTKYLPANVTVPECKRQRVVTPRFVVDVAELTAGHIALLVAMGIDLATEVTHKAREAAGQTNARFFVTGPQIFFKREAFMLEAVAWIDCLPVDYEDGLKNACEGLRDRVIQRVSPTGIDYVKRATGTLPGEEITWVDLEDATYFTQANAEQVKTRLTEHANVMHVIVRHGKPWVLAPGDNLKDGDQPIDKTDD